MGDSLAHEKYGGRGGPPTFRELFDDADATRRGRAQRDGVSKIPPLVDLIHVRRILATVRRNEQALHRIATLPSIKRERAWALRLAEDLRRYRRVYVLPAEPARIEPLDAAIDFLTRRPGRPGRILGHYTKGLADLTSLRVPRAARPYSARSSSCRPVADPRINPSPIR